MDAERVKFVRVVPPHVDDVARRAQQHWDLKDPTGWVFGRAEIFEGEEQWGVRLHDRAPQLAEDELLRMLARLLVWHAKCRTDTVDVVLGRNHARHTLVRVGGDYV